MKKDTSPDTQIKKQRDAPRRDKRKNTSYIRRGKFYNRRNEQLLKRREALCNKRARARVHVCCGNIFHFAILPFRVVTPTEYQTNAKRKAKEQYRVLILKMAHTYHFIRITIVDKNLKSAAFDGLVERLVMIEHGCRTLITLTLCGRNLGCAR